MATKSENAEIAILQTQMLEHASLLQEVRGDVKEIKTTLLDYTQVFVPRKEFEAFKKSVRVNYLLISLITIIVTAMAYALISGGIHK